ncbi:MAG: redoxin domain-containing protein [Verrucomicrobiales bacterium]|nr:redoxin domain-containing protein [Verrucomicrobiales bacterium]
MIRLLTAILLLASPLMAAEKAGRVEIFVSTDCPIANAYSPEFSRLHEEYGAKGFEFLLVYPDPSTTDSDIATHREEYSLTIPGVTDPDHKRVKSAGAKITPEAAVYNSTGELVYRGRIDNLFNDYGDKRRVVTEHYLRSVLAQLVEGESLSFTEMKAIGCYIEPLD